MRSVIALILLFVSNSVLAQSDLYSVSAENLPEVGIEQTVYLGDKMVQQRFGYYVQCLTPRTDLLFASKFNEKTCLRSTQRFEKNCCLNGIRQIEEDGLLCPTGTVRSGNPLYEGVNFYSFQRKDGSEKSKTSRWSLRENKKKKRWYQEPAGAKVVDLPKSEFDSIFLEEQVFDADVVQLKAGVAICKELADDYFQTDGQRTIDSGSIISIIQGQISEFPATLSGGYSRAVTLVNHEGKPKIVQQWSWDGKTFDDVLSDPVWTKHGVRRVLDLTTNFTYEDAFESSRPYRIKNDRLQQSIEYAGRVGDTLTFIYSEFMGGMARDAFTREFRIDLSEGNVGAFKGAVFEVLDATNATIRYKIIRHFPEA